MEENKPHEKIWVIFLCVLSKLTRKCEFPCGFEWFSCVFFQNRQGNANFPCRFRYFPVRCFKINKEILVFLRVQLFYCALFQNRQENANFPMRNWKNPSEKLNTHRKNQFPVVYISGWLPCMIFVTNWAKILINMMKLNCIMYASN